MRRPGALCHQEVWYDFLAWFQIQETQGTSKPFSCVYVQNLETSAGEKMYLHTYVVFVREVCVVFVKQFFKYIYLPIAGHL